LHFENNPIRDEGARFIADALKSNQTLTTLNLGRSFIRLKGAQFIAEALKINHTITTLNLEVIVTHMKIVQH